MQIRGLVSALVMLAPRFLKPFLYRVLLGYSVGRHVSIGFSLINARHACIGDNVRIGNFNRFKGLDDLHIGPNCNILTANTFTTSFPADGRRIPSVSLGRDVGISIGHYFDVQDRLTIGEFTTMAGVGTQIFTHYIDVADAQQKTAPVVIGPHCMVGSGVRIAPGANVGANSVVAMGTVVPGKAFPGNVLLAGNPCSVKRELKSEAAYFSRRRGEINYEPEPGR